MIMIINIIIKMIIIAIITIIVQGESNDNISDNLDDDNATTNNKAKNIYISTITQFHFSMKTRSKFQRKDKST